MGLGRVRFGEVTLPALVPPWEPERTLPQGEDDDAGIAEGLQQTFARAPQSTLSIEPERQLRISVGHVSLEHVVPDVVPRRLPEHHKVRAILREVFLEREEFLILSVTAGADAEDPRSRHAEIGLQPPLRHRLEGQGGRLHLGIAQEDDDVVHSRVGDLTPAEAQLVSLRCRCRRFPTAQDRRGSVTDQQGQGGDEPRSDTSTAKAERSTTVIRGRRTRR